jgi:hypothetical protein
MFSRRIARISVAVALCAAFGLHQTVASGQPADGTEKITQLNREALAAMDKREFEKARELLKRALDLCKTAGLEQHPVAARTHVHMGVVIIQGFKSPELGKKQFEKALAIDPNIGITKSLSTAELEEAFAEVKAEVGALGTAAPGNADTGARAPAPPSPAKEAATRTEAPSSSGFSYHTVSEVKQGSSIIVTVTVEESLKFRKLVLAYREQGTSDFLGREMEPVGDGAYRAEIPASATNGSSVAYYMEAQDDDGNPVASRGTETRPLVIAFAATARPSTGHADATVERKAEARKKPADDDEEGDAGKMFVSLLVGSGFGYVSGKGETNADVPVSGTASGALLGHVAPEVGYWWKPDVMLSLQGRFQWVTGTTELVKDGKSYGTVPAALAVFAKATWLTSSSGSLRPFLSGGVGGGQIRHVVTFGNLNDCGPSGAQTCKDSVAAGPLLAEVGGGIFYRLSDSAELVLSTNAQVAAPKFTLNLDVNGGVGFVF